MNDTEPNEGETLRLPLWRNCLDLMRPGMAYGQTFPSEFFEQHLREKRLSMKFSLAVSNIRRELLADGFYLCGRGQKGNAYVVLPAASNRNVMACFSRRAADALRRGVILGTNTRIDALSTEDRRKHEAILERMATKCALLKRSEQIGAVIAKTKPALLE